MNFIVADLMYQNGFRSLTAFAQRQKVVAIAGRR